MPRLTGLKKLVGDVLRPTDAEGNPLPLTQIEVKLTKESQKKLAIGGGIFLIVQTVLIIVAINLSD